MTIHKKSPPKRSLAVREWRSKKQRVTTTYPLTKNLGQVSRASDAFVFCANEFEKPTVLQDDEAASTTSRGRATSRASSGFSPGEFQSTPMKTRLERYKSVLDAKDDAPSESKTPYTRIQKVPLTLRENKELEKYFEPRVVSIGPYHYGKLKLKPAETLKLKFTRSFIDGKRDIMEGLYEQIMKEIQKLRDCYDKESTKNYDDEALAWMLFVDACSVLHYIDCRMTNGAKDLKFKDHLVPFFDQDLFLLENQLPFGVLKLLMSSNFEGMKTMEYFCKKIEEFIEMMNFEAQRGKERKQQQDTEEKHSHLLDLLRRRLIGRNCQKCDSKEDNWHSFRNVKELTAAGINLKPNETADCLMDVSFESHYYITGDLKLPPIVVDDSTKPKFLNLIAYEMSPGVESQLEFTSYICFLDSLIDHPDDVKQLRAAHIVHNCLGSDEEVAKLFNEISTDLVTNPDIYKDVKAKIQKHYDSKGKCWMAQFIHDHFSSPWSLLAFIGALLALLLTFVQTYFAISPLPSDCDGLCDYLKKRYI